MSNYHRKVSKGKILAYRVFDIGGEIHLKTAQDILVKKESSQSFDFRRKQKSIILSEKPLVVHLAKTVVSFSGKSLELNMQAKIWSFGAISIRAEYQFAEAHALNDIANLGYYLENDMDFHAQMLQQAQYLVEIIKPAVKEIEIWKHYEDYLIFSIEEASDLPLMNPQTLIEDDIAAIILVEKPSAFADATKEFLRKKMIQYSQEDFVFIHWNSAVIFDHSDFNDIAETLEFALCQLLELRYYDQLIDRQLNQLYNDIENTPPSIFNKTYSKLSKQAALHYIDFSEIVDRVGNAIKSTDDFYYASILQAASENFQIPDWRKSVSRKLNNLAEVAKLFQGEVNEKRNQLMEMTIIVLIAIEVVPLVVKTISSFF